MSGSEQLTLALQTIAPSVVLLLGGSLLLCASVFVGTNKSQSAEDRRTVFGAVTIAFLIVASFMHWFGFGVTDTTSPGAMFLAVETKFAAERLTLIGGFILVLLGWSLAPKNYLPEYYGCLLLILAGIPLVGAANDLIVMFLALELVSIPTYILLSVAKGENVAFEAALKYFMLSAFSSCFFLLGCSYLYGVSGTMDLATIQQSLTSGAGGSFGILAIGFVFCGLAFRITAVPFHFYAPDVFEGTSLLCAAILSYLPKVAGFIAIIRLLGEKAVSMNLANELIPILLIVASVTMCVGNIMAVAQVNLRRILGYSSVAHTGYLLLALAALMLNGAKPAVLFSYLAAYAAMTLGMFACLAEIDEAGGKTETVGDLAGMFFRRPAAAIAMTICLLSLIGLPLTAGFVAKLQIFFAAGGANRWDMSLVTLLMAVNAAVAAGYYFRILSKMFERGINMPALRLWRPSLFLAYSICVVLTIVWFFQPTSM